jgi:hypothetical protein
MPAARRRSTPKKMNLMSFALLTPASALTRNSDAPRIARWSQKR